MVVEIATVLVDESVELVLEIMDDLNVRHGKDPL